MRFVKEIEHNFLLPALFLKMFFEIDGKGKEFPLPERRQNFCLFPEYGISGLMPEAKHETAGDHKIMPIDTERFLCAGIEFTVIDRSQISSGIPFRNRTGHPAFPAPVSGNQLFRLLEKLPADRRITMRLITHPEIKRRSQRPFFN